MRVTIYSLIVLVATCSIASGRILVHSGRNTSFEIYSVPLEYEGNSATFGDVIGQPVFQFRPGWQQQGKIVFVRWYSYLQPHLETLLLEAAKHNPVAAVVYATSPRRVMGYPQYVRFAIDTMEVTFPVVQMDQDKFEEYETLYNSTNGNITLIIDDEGRNEWVDVRTSGWFIFFGISLGLFELVNLSCAVWVLSGHWPFQKSLVTVCLFLEIGANILRLLFLVDPWSGWSYGRYPWPNNLITVLFTISLPATTAVTILLTFYWAELVSKNPSLQLSALLTKSKVPAIICITLVCVFEILSSCARSAIGGVLGLTILNGAIYLIVVLVLLSYYIYVSVKVMRFLRKLTRLRSQQKLLRKVTIRACFCAVGLVGLIIAAIMPITPVYEAPGQTYVHWFVHFCTNWVSITQILAFERPKRSSSKTSANSNSAMASR